MAFSIPEIHDRLNTIESEYDLFDRTVDGIRYWERIRNDVYDNICESVGVFGEANFEPGDSWNDRFRGLYLLFRNAIVRNPYLTNQHECLFYSHPRRKKLDDGTWWDLYTDPILEEVDFDAASFEYDHELEHYTPARTQGLRYTDLIEYSGTVYKKLSRYSLPDTEARYLSEVEDKFESIFGIEVNVLEAVRSELVERRLLVPLYERLLARVKPKVVVIVVSYGKESFIEACQNVGVPVVELQHGSISKYHCGYSFPPGRQKDTFPDYFLTFGPFWKNRLHFPIDEENVYDVGYPYLEWKSSELKRESCDKLEKSDQSVLFISQGTIGGKLSKFAAKVADSIGEDHSLVYKLHPDEYSIWERKYPWLVDSEIEVHADDSTSLYELFSRVDALVGVYSTAVYEGLYFDLDTFVVNMDGKCYIQDLIDEGVVTSVSSPSDLISNLKGDRPTEYDSSRFFKTGAVQETERVLARIMKQESK
jgi:hypothetical protein